MRLEQLVLHGPGEDDRIRFGNGVTVFSGLGPKERAELLSTLAQALTGRLPVASVVYEDHAGRRVFADRTGATDAVTGARLPGPGQLLGHDPDAVAGLMRVTAADLGLDAPRTVDTLKEDLASAQAHLDKVAAEYQNLSGQADLLTTWQEELEVLNKRIIQSQDDAERWEWVQRKHRVDHLRSELSMLGGEPEENDARILAAVDTLRAAGQAWADAVGAAEDLREEIGPLPEIDPTHLARVAATPDQVPTDVSARIQAWRDAVDARMEAEAALAALDDGPPTIDDPLVSAFAACDQTRLWAAHAQLEAANAAYLRVTSNATAGGLAPETEEMIETAHREVVRCEREVERRFRPGALGAGAFAVGALLAGQAISIVLGVVMLVAAVVMGFWLIVMPRRDLARAVFSEEAALSHADGGSWLGLHLRRLDAFTDPNERRSLEDAANGRAAAQLDWDEAANGLSLEDLTSRTEAVQEYVRATDPRVVARRKYDETARHNAAVDAEKAASHKALAGLEPWGILPESAATIELDGLSELLDQRVAAGRLARRVVELREIEAKEAEAGEALSQVLIGLGHADGDLEGRMIRAIAAVDSARRRAGTDPGGRTRADVQAEIAELELRLETGRRPNWADTPDPTGPPADPNLLDARRRDINELMNTAGKIDVVGAEHRLSLAQAEVAELQRRLDQTDAEPTSLQSRIIARLDRVTVLEGNEDTVPVLLDDPFGTLPTGECLDILDLLVRLSGHVQVIVLTADPRVARWGRDRSRNPAVVLYESTVEPVPARAPKLVHQPVDHHVIPAEAPAMVEIY